MKKLILTLTILLSLFFVGCGTKRQYFEPQETTSNLSLNGNLPSTIEFVTNGGATLKNGNIITNNGINHNVKLPSGFKLLNATQGKIIASDINGNLKVMSNDTEIYSNEFPSAIVAASIDLNLLAAISSENELYLIDISNKSILMQYKSADIFAVDSRIASPYFLGSLVIFPSLDGKIYIANKAGQILKDVVVSSEHFFNNIIFLDVVNDSMIAATAKRLIVIDPSKSAYYNAEIKDVLLADDKIYIFKKDGGIAKLDLNLQELAKAYYKFALFSNVAVFNNHLYIIEKKGYLIRTDLNLKHTEIFNLNNEIDEKNFMGDDTFYYANRFVKFN